MMHISYDAYIRGTGDQLAACLFDLSIPATRAAKTNDTYAQQHPGDNYIGVYWSPEPRADIFCELAIPDASKIELARRMMDRVMADDPTIHRLVVAD